MIKSLATKSSLAAGLAMIGALVVLAPQQASAGRFGGFHGGGAAHISVARPAFHPVFRPAFRPALHFAPRHTMIGGFRPTRGAGLVRHAGGHGLGERGMRQEHGHERGHERTRLGRLEHERGRHGHGRGGYAPAFYQPDYADPDTAAPTDVTPQPVVRPAIGSVSGPVAAGGAPITDKAAGASTPATCQPGTGTGSAVDVTFAPKATAADVSNFLKAYNVTIVDGPSKDNRYRVRLSDKSLSPNEVMQAVQSMQSQTAIVSTVSVF